MQPAATKRLHNMLSKEHIMFHFQLSRDPDTGLVTFFTHEKQQYLKNGKRQKHDFKIYTQIINHAQSNERIKVHFQWSRDLFKTCKTGTSQEQRKIETRFQNLCPMVEVEFALFNQHNGSNFKWSHEPRKHKTANIYAKTEKLWHLW